MITVQQLFNILATGVYSNTAFSGTNSILKVEHYDKVINSTNMGIVEIYKRFKLLENELVLCVVPEVTRYYLRADRVASVGQTTVDQYIEENFSTDGFLNIIEVTGAYDTYGIELELNSIKCTPRIMQVAPDILQITNILSAQSIGIVYQSYPDKIVIDSTFRPADYEINIPDTIIDPLVLYIAAKTFKPIGANDSTANADKSASYEQQYELACQKLSMYGLALQGADERDSFISNGWV